MVSAIFVAAALFMQAAPAAGATPAADPAAAPAGSSAVSPLTVTGKKAAAVDLSQSEVVCHSEAVIGSLFPRKVCASRREMTERKREDRQVVEDFQKSAIAGQQPH
jgi:hypothetical protein